MPRETLSQERKRLQKEGKCPIWFSTGSWQLFKTKYLYDADNPLEQYTRIARTAASHMPEKTRDEWFEKFFALLWNGWLSPSTPVLSNMGTNRALPVSCAGSYIPDSINGIYKKRHTTAMLTKMGFGTAGYLGDIRGRGASIHGGGKSVGVLPVMKSFWADMDYVAQGSTRRGSWAGYLPIDHPDFYEVVEYLEANPNGVNIGWCVSDQNIRDMLAGDEELNLRYGTAMRTKMITGKGYWFFPDKANARRPMMYVDRDLTVKSPQLCLVGDTMVIVSHNSNGDDAFEMRIDSIAVMMQLDPNHPPLYAKSYNVEHGIDEWKLITNAAVTGCVSELISVTEQTTQSYVMATRSHKFFEVMGQMGIEASELRLGDVLFTSEEEGTVGKLETIELDVEIPVYDITVEDNHNFFANDILVHNCNEIMLHSGPDPEEPDMNIDYTCVLSSMNLARYDEWKGTSAIFDATVFLDCVVSEFIHLAKNGLRGEGPIEGLEEAVAGTERGRAIGLGVLGYHTYMLDHKIPFESFEGHMFNLSIFKELNAESTLASEYLAELLGEPKWCKGYGVRNTHRIALAPTKSTSIMMGGITEGINPVGAYVFTQRTPAGEIDRIDPSFLKLMKEKGMYTDEVVVDIREHNGSCQHVDWLTSEEKDVFKTAYEIDQHSIVSSASARSDYVDQWMSLNLFFGADESEDVINDVHAQAMMDKKILGLYYINSTRDALGISASKDECEACQ